MGLEVIISVDWLDLSSQFSFLEFWASSDLKSMILSGDLEWSLDGLDPNKNNFDNTVFLALSLDKVKASGSKSFFTM